MRQRKSKVCSLTHEFPTFAGTAGPKPETRLTLTFPIIHHNKMTAVELAIQTVSFEIKDMSTHWALPNLLSGKVYRFPWIHLSFLWRVEARGHKTCAALFFVLDSAVQILKIRSHNCTIVAEMALMKDSYIKGFSSKHPNNWQKARGAKEIQKYSTHAISSISRVEKLLLKFYQNLDGERADVLQIQLQLKLLTYLHHWCLQVVILPLLFRLVCFLMEL